MYTLGVILAFLLPSVCEYKVRVFWFRVETSRRYAEPFEN